METSAGFIHAREMAGKFGFFQDQGIIGKLCDVSEKNEILQKNIREMSQNFTFHVDINWIFGHDVAFVLNL